MLNAFQKLPGEAEGSHSSQSQAKMYIYETKMQGTWRIHKIIIPKGE